MDRKLEKIDRLGNDDPFLEEEHAQLVIDYGKEKEKCKELQGELNQAFAEIEEVNEALQAEQKIISKFIK